MATKANVTLVEGDMGSGKTNTAVATCVDKYKISVVQNRVSIRGHEKDIREGKKPRDIVPVKKIFTNFTLYGVVYVKCNIADMIRQLNNKLIKDAILVIDETYIEADARRGMSQIALIMTWFGMQMRKRHIELYIIVQHGRMLDWRFKFIASQTIQCKYNERTRKVSLLIQEVKSGKSKTVSYNAAQYWKNFDTDELPEIPEKMIEAALAKVS